MGGVDFAWEQPAWKAAKEGMFGPVTSLVDVTLPRNHPSGLALTIPCQSLASTDRQVRAPPHGRRRARREPGHLTNDSTTGSVERR